MKKLLMTLFALVSLCSAAEARTLDEIMADGNLKIATEGATPPFNFFDGDTLTGSDIDLGNTIGKKLGVKVQWTSLPFDSLLIGLNQDKYDLVIAGHGITPERSQAVDFTDPYVCSGAAIVSLPGGPQSVKDIKGHVVGVQVGTTYLEAVERVGTAADILTFPKDTDAAQNLLLKKTDIWISDRLTALDTKAKNPAAKDIQIGDLLFVEKQGMAVAKGNTTVLGAVNGALKTAFQDGSYASIMQKWLGEDVRCK